MVDINENIESPFDLKISFNKLLEHYEVLAEHSDAFISAKAKRILKTASAYPILRDGFSDISIVKEREKEISVILQDSFSPVLTLNEIKTASIPFHSMIFNSSERFKNIIKAAGEDFELNIKNMPEDDMYLIACTIILNFCYGYNLNFKRPFYYEIPDENGILRVYKILYNADFTEILPKANAKKITQEDYNELIDNYENIALWKEKFPPHSYVFKGFVISNIFDVTEDQSISNIKSSLIAEDRRKNDDFIQDFQGIFRSLLGISDIQVGVSIFDPVENELVGFYGNTINSFLLGGEDNEKCDDLLCDWSYKTILEEKKYCAISDIETLAREEGACSPHIHNFNKQGIKSVILAPIANDDGLMGVLEIVSRTPKALNSINANKLIDVMPFIVSAVERSKNEEANLIEAIIQKECTSIHPSVKWRFEKEAKSFINAEMSGLEPSFKRLVFENVYPLYGQIDIKGSSEARNQAARRDLSLQLKAVKDIFESVLKVEKLGVYEQIIFELDSYLKGLDDSFQVDSEQQIADFLSQEINPVLAHFESLEYLRPKLGAYRNSIDSKVNVLYKHRKAYDDTIAHVNKEMASLLDEKQEEAQSMYPHYFERFKTDGVEHNMYIGESITKEDSFNPIYLYNLRLWQLQVMVEMENAYYLMRPNLPVELDVASLILVFNQPLSISFKTDEKQFDVDGTYNARYEIVKKRVDKSFVKGTQERVTQKGKITIIYSQKQDEIEYLRYISFLQAKNYLDTDAEIVELDDLQAVTGLKAIRVSVLYHKNEDDKAFYTYDDLIKEIRN